MRTKYKKTRKNYRGGAIPWELLKKLAFELGPELLKGPVKEVGEFASRKLKHLLGNGKETIAQKNMRHEGHGTPYYPQKNLQFYGQGPLSGMHGTDKTEQMYEKKKRFQPLSRLNA